MTSGHYANAFSPELGQCFRFVHNGVGHAQHCPGPVVARGQFTDGKGRKWTVDGCEEHAGELNGARAPSPTTTCGMLAPSITDRSW